MELKKIIIIIQILLSIGITSNAQSLLLNEFNLPMDNARVKFVNEFMARFNGKEIRDERYPDRMSNVILLFNRFLFKDKLDSLFLEAKAFSETVINNSIYLNYTDTCWYAKVKCHGTLAKKNVEFFLYFFVEERGDFMYKWVIADAEGEIFNTSRSRKHKELFIMPNDHEQSFMSLKHVINETSRYIDDYVKDGYETTSLSVFLTLVRSEQLTIDYVSDVEFTFLQVPNYSFSVKYFERNDMNLGWLISSFEKCNEAEKSQILCSLHRITNRDVEVVKYDDIVAVDSVVPELSEMEDTVSTYYSTDSLLINEKVVRRFGNILHLWMETGDIDYQKKAVKECAGKRGRECTVSESVMSFFVMRNGLPQDSVYKLKDYFAGLKLLRRMGNITIDFDNITKVNEEDDYDIVSCDVILTGEMNVHSSNVFYIRKKDHKIFRIKALNND